MALNNRVESGHFPYVSIHLVGPNQTISFDLITEALIDTGFDGEVMIPRTMVSRAVVPNVRTRWQLGDGSVVEAEAYRGTVQIVGLENTITVTISALGTQTLIGAALIARFRVILDHGASVTFEP